MKVTKGLKKVYKGLSPYNRRKLIEANRPCGKEKRKPKKNA
jgi:hypothetical protein